MHLKGKLESKLYGHKTKFAEEVKSPYYHSLRHSLPKQRLFKQLTATILTVTHELQLTRGAGGEVMMCSEITQGRNAVQQVRHVFEQYYLGCLADFQQMPSEFK